ncbi:hypothetical protein ACPA9J_03540 [Pseudomonas aeruginosa]
MIVASLAQPDAKALPLLFAADAARDLGATRVLLAAPTWRTCVRTGASTRASHHVPHVCCAGVDGVRRYRHRRSPSAPLPLARRGLPGADPCGPVRARHRGLGSQPMWTVPC